MSTEAGGEFERSAPTGSGAPPAITVVVPVFNAERTLAELLDALLQQTFDGSWELILADNHSSDGSIDVAGQYLSRLPLRIVRADAVRGAAHARNVGVREARAAKLAFVDADDVVAKDWLAVIEDALERHEVVVSRFDKVRLNSPELQSLRNLVQEHGLAQHDYAAFLPHAGGSGLAVRREAHERIGGFDERLRRLQDTDYTWRLQLAGYALHFEPKAVLHVRFRAAGRQSLAQAFHYGRFDGMLYDKYRHLGMEKVPMTRDLRLIASQALTLLLRPRRGSRAKRLRSLANRVGIVVGRCEGVWRPR